jgi:hypothetical protein
MKEKILSLLTLTALILALASPAMAAFSIVVDGYTNLPPNYSSSGTISTTPTGTYQILAQRFSTLSLLTNVNLTATLLMSQTTSGSPQVAIWSGSLSQPLSLITTLSLASSFSGTLANTTFTASGVTLPQSNTYWVTLTAPTGQYDWSTANGGTGGIYYNGTIWQNIQQPGSFQMKLVSSPATVPEPSTYALLCISLGVVGFVRKKMVKSEG